MRNLHSCTRTYSLLLTDRMFYGFYQCEALLFLCFGNLRQELLPYIFAIDIFFLNHLTFGSLALLFLLLLSLIIHAYFFVSPSNQCRIIEYLLFFFLLLLKFFQFPEPLFFSEFLVSSSMLLKLILGHGLLHGSYFFKLLFTFLQSLSLGLLFELLLPFLVKQASMKCFRVPARATSTPVPLRDPWERARWAY